MLISLLGEELRLPCCRDALATDLIPTAQALSHLCRGGREGGFGGYSFLSTALGCFESGA